MPGYVTKALDKFQHKTTMPQFSPNEYVCPTFAQKVQFAPQSDSTLKTMSKEMKYVQLVVGIFLYYSRAMDPTMIVALNEIASVQSKPSTQHTNKKCS